MRYENHSIGLLAVVLCACAHTPEPVHTAAPLEPASSRDREIIAVDSMPPPEMASEPPPSRPRLSHTVTLGQGTEPPYMPYMPSAPPSRAEPAQSQTVVVNNNVVVQGAVGSYGYRWPATFYAGDGRAGGSRGSPQWGATGWEGARRTAAPGQTPAVGGNWAPPPSYGPSQMK